MRRVPMSRKSFSVSFVSYVDCCCRHDIYKWQQDQRRQARPRAVSFAGSTNTSIDPAFEHIHEPGGFRRNYVLLQGDNGVDDRRVLNNFIDFLYIFGHFVSSLRL